MILFNNISERASSKDVNIEKQYATLRIESNCFNLWKFAYHTAVGLKVIKEGNLKRLNQTHSSCVYI